jgi:AmmeMemoRadiSam system protein B/AmmeMemoRadiSam system protein A
MHALLFRFPSFTCLILWLLCCSVSASDLRPPSVAGQFYPANKKALASDIKELLNKLPNLKQLTGKIYGFIVPHAGYEYSGKTAAYAFKILEKIPVHTIIIIGPYHKANFSGVSIWDKGKWKTPLGSTSIDYGLASAIKKYSKNFEADLSLHLSEHSVEVELPFIQMVAPKALIVPILISDPSYSQTLAKAIYENTRNKNIIVLASSDLSHYHSDNQARLIDKGTIETIKNGDPTAFHQALTERRIELCGGAAVLTLLELSSLWESSQIEILDSSNSGDSSGNLNKVVGYVSAIAHKDEPINHADQRWLLELARTTLTSFLKNKEAPTPKIPNLQLSEQKAVFVTLWDQHGKLRGCIGQLKAQEPLYEAVQNMVIAAATKDSRFAPVKLDEVKTLTIEISILSEPKVIRSASDIKMGKQGVIVSKGTKRGVFLPEVAEQFNSKEDFLSELCSQKAKLPRNCWTDPSVKFEVFTTQSFREQCK